MTVYKLTLSRDVKLYQQSQDGNSRINPVGFAPIDEIRGRKVQGPQDWEECFLKKDSIIYATELPYNETVKGSIDSPGEALYLFSRIPPDAYKIEKDRI